MPNTATTPRRISHTIKEFCAELSTGSQPTFVPVSPKPDAVPARCYANVNWYIHEHGGDFQHGWTIWEEPDIFLSAEHHCVHVHNGRYLDITPPLDGERKILFLPTRPPGRPDTEQLMNRTVDGMIRNRYFPLASEESAKIVDLLRRREDASLQTGEWQYLDSIVDRLITEQKTKQLHRTKCLQRKQKRQRRKLERKRKRRSQNRR